jgi:hypothetical protein
MSVRLPEPSLLRQVVPRDWEHATTLNGVEIWRGRIITMADELRQRRLYEPSGGFRFLFSDNETSKVVAAVRHEGRIVSYAMLSQDGYYGTALPMVKTDVCLGNLGMWSDPDHRERGHARKALEGIFHAIQGLMELNQGRFHVVWAQAHVAHYMRCTARRRLSDFDFDILAFQHLDTKPRQYPNGVILP